MIFSSTADDFVLVTFAQASASFDVTEPPIDLESLDCGAKVPPSHALRIRVEAKQGFDVVPVVQTPAGGGIFMRKADKLSACFAAETPTSTTIATRYCKPVE